MRAETHISDIERNRERYDSNSERSDISYTPYLPNDASISSLNHRDESNFGCDAVNFKNSLVLERESMKKTQREKVDMFIKKKTLISSAEMDHQSQQLSNLKNRRKNHNEYSDRKGSQQMVLSDGYQQSYVLAPEYMVKRGASPYEFNRTINNISIQPALNNWDQKRPYQ